MVAVGSVCTLHRVLPPPQHKPSLRSNARTHRARLAGLLSSCQVTTEWPRARGHAKVMVWVSALPSHITKHKIAKKRPEDFPSPEFSPENFSFLLPRQKLKYGTGLGFIPCLLKEILPHSPLPSSLVLGQLHLVDVWKLGFIQHLKICLLRLLLQALANFLTNKHLPVKLEMEILTK